MRQEWGLGVVLIMGGDDDVEGKNRPIIVHILIIVHMIPHDDNGGCTKKWAFWAEGQGSG